MAKTSEQSTLEKEASGLNGRYLPTLSLSMLKLDN
jgi:hypothetical protein